MTKRLCDRCGKEMYYHPASDVVSPAYKIQKMVYPNWRGMVEIDLCASCCKEFDEWLNTKEEING